MMSIMVDIMKNTLWKLPVEVRVKNTLVGFAADTIKLVKLAPYKEANEWFVYIFFICSKTNNPKQTRSYRSIHQKCDLRCWILKTQYWYHNLLYSKSTSHGYKNIPSKVSTINPKYNLVRCGCALTRGLIPGPIYPGRVVLLRGHPTSHRSR